MARLNFLDKVFVGLLLAIFAGIVIHTPVTLWLGTVYPDVSLLLKSWKEILMGVAVLVGILVLYRRQQLRLLLHPLILVAGLYALLHLALIPFMYENATTILAGILIDLRYILFFVLLFVAISLYPQLRKVFVAVFAVGAIVVCGFAVLQVFILPPDVLSALGYGDTTISPYLTVDENPDYIRVNSTLRGPNPLGAYGVIVIALVLACILKYRRSASPKILIGLGLLGVAGFVAVWASYSRSALLALIVVVGSIVTLTIGRQLNKGVWIGILVALGALAGGVYAARDTSFISNVILHENASTGATVSSNQGHIDSLEDGIARLVRQPIGVGIGSTGSASLYSSEPVVIENQYLFIAHEVGWLGLALFLVLFIMILWQLWRQRSDWLALSVFASGLGLALIGLLLPVWVDDTVSIIWWGLAAIVIGGFHDRQINKTSKRAA